MTGKGFPLSADRTFTLQLCGVDVQVLSVANTQITFIAPPCAVGPSTVNLTFNGQSDSTTFTYNAIDASVPTIMDISPKTFSPVLKGFMTITGSGFGSNKNDLTVWLNNGSNVYQMNVIEANDTTLKVRIPGGLPGDFDVLVQKAGLGYAQVNPVGANAFTYGIFVDSISPSTGSINGGTILTITGSNFSPVLLENQAYIGDAINWNCIVLTATTTTITCRTPPIN